VTKYRILEASTDSMARLGRALASPIRIRALQALKRGELCLCEISALFGLADSTASKHMSLLGDVGLVQSRREGRWTHYSLPDRPTPEVAEVLELVDRMAAADPVVKDDAGRIGGLCCGPARTAGDPE
jgi:DNA-binding transcriptional ArsR family regulator